MVTSNKYNRPSSNNLTLAHYLDDCQVFILRYVSIIVFVSYIILLGQVKTRFAKNEGEINYQPKLDNI